MTFGPLVNTPPFARSMLMTIACIEEVMSSVDAPTGTRNTFAGTPICLVSRARPTLTAVQSLACVRQAGHPVNHQTPADLSY